MSPSKHTLLLLPLSFLLFSSCLSPVLAQCYLRNGTRVPSTDYQPCNSQIGAVSMCCASNRTMNADTCLANGLCQNYAENDAGNNIVTILWRESCSDRTWQSPFCLNLCTIGSGKE